MRSSSTLLTGLLLLFISTGCAGTTTAPGVVAMEGRATSTTLSRDVQDVQQALIDERITGGNVARVWHDGEVLYEGVVDSGREGDAAVTDDTLFPIWSMSKPITIVAMLLLHEQGLFEWDDPVAEYIPAFSDLQVKDGEGTRPAVEPLRIQHLMTHRSGYIYFCPRCTTGPAPTRRGSPTWRSSSRSRRRTRWSSSPAASTRTGSIRRSSAGWRRS